MKSLKLALLIIFISCCIPMKSNACQCTHYHYNFTEYIRASHIIMAAEVVEHIDGKYDFGVTWSLTKLVVFKWYQNKMESDTIYFSNGSNQMCEGTLRFFNVGEKVILKAFNYQSNIRGYKNVVHYGACDTGVLRYINGMVVGDINKNYQNRSRKRERFIGKLSEKWADKMIYKRRQKPRKEQKMNFKKFNRMMAIKWDAIYMF